MHTQPSSYKLNFFSYSKTGCFWSRNCVLVNAPDSNKECNSLICWIYFALKSAILPGDALVVVAVLVLVLALVLVVVPAGDRSCFGCRLPAKA